MSFGDKIKQIRNEKSLTQDALAEIMGVHRQSVSKWEYSGGFPTIENLLKLANELDISLDWLFEEELGIHDNSDTQSPLLPVMTAGIEAISSAIDGVMKEIISDTKKQNNVENDHGCGDG